MHITFVKKILASGDPCQKCKDVEERLRVSGQMSKIDEVLIADERDPTSAGAVLAEEVGAQRAPFFVVEKNSEDGLAEGETETTVYTVYFKFAKEVLGNAQSKKDENKEILNDNPDLDFI